MESGHLWHLLFKAICRELDAFEGAVREGQQLEPAHSFCSFLTNSYLLKLLSEHDAPEPLVVNSKLIEWRVEELLRDIRHRYVTGDKTCAFELSELQRISHKLDLIAAQVGRVFPAPEIDVSAPPLRVIKGGVK